MREKRAVMTVGNIDILTYRNIAICRNLRQCKSRANCNSNSCLKRLFETVVCQCKRRAKQNPNASFKRAFETCVSAHDKTAAAILSCAFRLMTFCHVRKGT